MTPAPSPLQPPATPSTSSSAPLVPEPPVAARYSRLVWPGLLLLFLVVLVRTAWVSDDAYITFRVVENFLQGFGLTWNVDERVQAFTHPLWLFALAGARLLIPDLYLASLVLSLGLTVWTLNRLGKAVASSLPLAGLALLALVGSKAFVDFSTSGLENPLTHLLLVFFISLYIKGISSQRPPLLALSLCTGLALTNRMDVGLLLGPALAWASYLEVRGAKSTLYGLGVVLRGLLLGLSPFVAWEAFSLFYYGFPFPNTAYAKLSHGIPALELLVQGLRYLSSSVQEDPLTLPLLVAGILVPALPGRRGLFPLALGSLLYVLYVVKIGGDFMNGRFLAAPFLVSICLLSSLNVVHVRGMQATAVVLSLLILTSPHPSILSGADYGLERPEQRHGIVDERRYYYPASGLLTLDGSLEPHHPSVADGKAIREKASREGPFPMVSRYIGYGGYYAGREVTVIDPLALADPLLARLPVRADKPWRIGHFERLVPAGYLRSRADGQNHLVQPALAEYYRHLKTLVSSPLWAEGRLAEIWRFNRGDYQPLLETYRHPPAWRLAAGDVVVPLPMGGPWDMPGTHLLSSAGIHLQLQEVTHATKLEVSASVHPSGVLTYSLDGQELGTQEITPTLGAERLEVYQLVVPPAVASQGFDAVHVRASGEGYPQSFGHLRLLP